MHTLQFDYIIVGGGTSGCVIAHRLASETTASILLLEAGRDTDSPSDVLVPGKYIHQLQHDRKGLWELETRPQPQLNGRSITFLRGRQMGGSSAVNYMAMARGPADDYDEWARVTGDDRWKWKNVLPRMKAMEDFDLERPVGFEHLASPDPNDHGFGGPIKLGMGKTMTPGVASFVAACQEAGIDRCSDINCGNPIGVGLAQFNVRDGKRYYAANAYLPESFRTEHSNLRIQTNVEVRRLLLEDTTVRGVTICNTGSDNEVDVLSTKCVILCAGTFASPQILLASGIGPQGALEEQGLAATKDLPGVGTGMLDHSILTLEFRVKDPAMDFCRLFNEKELIEAAEKQYRKDRTGPLSVFGTSGAVAFPKIERLVQSAEFQDLDEETQAFLLHPQRPSAEIWLGSGYSSYRGPVSSGQSFITFELLLQNNQSRGTVALRNTPEGPVLDLDPHFLEHPYDRRIAIETVRTALKISQSESYRAEIEEMVYGPETDDDDSILEFVRGNLGQGYHSLGTCKMGLADDVASVVTSDFNVIGVQGLKVADLSVCPVLTCNHTQINAYLIGDRCAAQLVTDWRVGSDDIDGRRQVSS